MTMNEDGQDVAREEARAGFVAFSLGLSNVWLLGSSLVVLIYCFFGRPLSVETFFVLLLGGPMLAVLLKLIAEILFELRAIRGSLNDR